MQKYADNSRAHNILREINFMSVFRDTLRDYQNREELLSSKGESNTSANSYVYANKSLHELENIRMEKEFFQICGEYLKQKYLTEPYREVS